MILLFIILLDNTFDIVDYPKLTKNYYIMIVLGIASPIFCPRRALPGAKLLKKFGQNFL